MFGETPTNRKKIIKYAWKLTQNLRRDGFLYKSLLPTLTQLKLLNLFPNLLPNYCMQFKTEIKLPKFAL